MDGDECESEKSPQRAEVPEFHDMRLSDRCLGRNCKTSGFKLEALRGRQSDWVKKIYRFLSSLLSPQAGT